MSRDNPQEKVDTVATVEALAETAKNTASVMDIAERARKAALERRSKSTVHGALGSVKALGHEKFVYPGFAAHYVNPAKDQCLILQDRGYDFVRDDKGEICFLTANGDKDANEHRFPYMEAPIEIVLEEMKENAQRANSSMTKGAANELPITAKMRNDPFFHDVGFSTEDI